MTSPLDKKLKITGPVLITANRLADGAVIYRTTDGGWTTQFSGAAVVNTAPAAIATPANGTLICSSSLVRRSRPSTPRCRRPLVRPPARPKG